MPCSRVKHTLSLPSFFMINLIKYYFLQVWLRCVQHLLELRKDSVQSFINRALLSLPTKKHIKFISHTAILEFKCGAPDMGRSMFEGILREHPKRTDIWSIYLDQVMFSYPFQNPKMDSPLLLALKDFLFSEFFIHYSF